MAINTHNNSWEVAETQRLQRIRSRQIKNRIGACAICIGLGVLTGCFLSPIAGGAVFLITGGIAIYNNS